MGNVNSINILFPVLNERLRLRNGIEKTISYLKKNVGIPYTLTILDNGSDDETPDIGKELEEKYPEVLYVRLNERGVGIAFREGIRLNESDIVGYMDIDLSTDLKYLGRTIKLFQKNPHLQYVNGSRFHKKSDTKGRKWYRKITSMGLVFLLKTIFHMRATDALCGFTFLRKEAANQLVRECSDDNGWFYTVEFLLRAERNGMAIYELPVEWQEDYNTTVKIFYTIKNYLIQINKLRKAFREESGNAKKN
ncbi:MAG: glycosyltransferase [Bacillus sp. (in: Bacteria)]|nr:glycosyltransferase [Bacillus sp. (in: firmicutes)]MCM1427003.1 glycosyltransferase [Eubacterium sp.]